MQIRRTQPEQAWLIRLVVLGLALVSLLAAGGCGRAQASQTETVAEDLGAYDLPPRPVVTDPMRLHAGSDPNSPCTCETAKIYNGWCWHCNVGYVGGVRVESEALFDAVDAHGHDLDLDAMGIEMCRDAVRNDGYCADAGIGFVSGKGYFSPFTYGLAKARPINPTHLTCEICRSHAIEPGWCERCRRGILGNFAFTDRDLFERTVCEHCTLLAAIDKAPICELCAFAMVAHRTCPRCRISYESAIPVSVASRATTTPQQPNRIGTGGE